MSGAAHGFAQPKAAVGGDGVFAPIVSGLRTAAVNFLAPGAAVPARQPAPQGCTCCGERAGNCHCNCCIVDADMVVYSRLGERRMVTLMFDNPRKREKTITLTLSGWTSRGGSPAPVRAILMPPAPRFVLAPCSKQYVTMQIETPVPGGAAEQGPTDVDNCTVYYAELSAEDCGRPKRIALALLPRDCNAYEFHCACCC